MSMFPMTFLMLAKAAQDIHPIVLTAMISNAPLPKLLPSWVRHSGLTRMSSPPYQSSPLMKTVHHLLVVCDPLSSPHRPRKL
jgi:hypothetical protein